MAQHLQIDHQAIEDLPEVLDRAVQLAGAHANTHPVDRRVRAAIDDHPAVRGDLDPITVAPDTWVHLEIALAVAPALRVVPEEQRHRGHRLGDDELAYLADDRDAVLVEGVHGG